MSRVRGATLVLALSVVTCGSASADVLSLRDALGVAYETNPQLDAARAQLPSNAKLVEDWEGHPVALFESEWSVRLAQEWNPSLEFLPYVTQEVVST